MIINLNARALEQAGIELRFLRTEDPGRLSESKINSQHLAELFLQKAPGVSVEMAVALQGLLNLYVGLANSGDAGYWNPEEVDEVIAARAALERI